MKLRVRGAGELIVGVGGHEDIDGDSRRLNRPFARSHENLKAPGAQPRKGHVHDLDAPHLDLLAVYMPGTIWMEMYMPTLFDNR
jgi:hypothetical protein